MSSQPVIKCESVYKIFGVNAEKMLLESNGNVDAQTFNYLKNVTSDIQEQFFDVYDYTIAQLALKRNLTNNIFNGDVFLKSSNNAYGYTIKPSYDSNQNKIDDNTISMLGYNSLILKSNLSCSIFTCNQATIGGGSQLSRVRRNLNIDNVLRVGYNDATDRGASLSNNARVDINGSIFVKDNILLNHNQIMNLQQQQ